MLDWDERTAAMEKAFMPDLHYGDFSRWAREFGVSREWARRAYRRWERRMEREIAYRAMWRMISDLPPAGSGWSRAEMERWLTEFAVHLHAAYGDDEDVRTGGGTGREGE